MSTFWTRRWVLSAILVAAFCVSLAYSLHFKIRPVVDAYGYDRIAWNLVQGNGYREDMSLSYDTDIAILRVGPGYEFFLAGVYGVFGHRYGAVWMIQALLIALSAWLAYALTRRIFRNEPRNFEMGIVAALFMAFSPDLVTMGGMLMSEVLGVFLVLLSAYLFFLYWDSLVSVWTRGWLVMTACVFGFTTLVRTPAAFLFFPFLYFFVKSRRWTDAVLFCAVLVMVFTPWTVRNYAIYHAFIPTNLAGGYDLLAGNHPGASGEFEPSELNEAITKRYGRIEGNTIALREAGKFIIQNPVEFLRLTLNRISIYFSIARPTGFWFHLHGWSQVATLASSALYSGLLFFFGFLGICTTRSLDPEDRRRARFLFALLLMMPLAIVGIIVETRYRFLSYPFFAVFAGFGAVRGFRRANTKVIVLVGGALLLNSFVDVSHNMSRIFERLHEIF